MEIKLIFETEDKFKKAVYLCFSNPDLNKYRIDTLDGSSLLVHASVPPILRNKGIACAAEVDAYEDTDWDGVWVKCPFCEHENSVSWSGAKKCNGCEGVLVVATGPLVKKQRVNLEELYDNTFSALEGRPPRRQGRRK